MELQSVSRLFTSPLRGKCSGPDGSFEGNVNLKEPMALKATRVSIWSRSSLAPAV